MRRRRHRDHHDSDRLLWGGFNVLDLHDSHPGERSANAGETPGYFDDAGVWHGSTGYDSSRLPQPGRSVLLSLRFEL